MDINQGETKQCGIAENNKDKSYYEQRQGWSRWRPLSLGSATTGHDCGEKTETGTLHLHVYCLGYCGNLFFDPALL